MPPDHHRISLLGKQVREAGDSQDDLLHNAYD
jgi:hypothetical protein